MSVFTHNAATAGEEADAYTRAVLDVLAGRDPMTVLRDGPRAFRDAVAGKSPTDVHRAEGPGKWSAAAVIQHMADSDLVWAYRLRMVLGQDRPPITGYDQDAWAAHFGYNEADVEMGLGQFAAMRTMNITLLESLGPAELARVGMHADRGEESVAHMIRLYAGHDLVHLRQLERILTPGE